MNSRSETQFVKYFERCVMDPIKGLWDTPLPIVERMKCPPVDSGALRFIKWVPVSLYLTRSPVGEHGMTPAPRGFETSGRREVPSKSCLVYRWVFSCHNWRGGSTLGNRNERLRNYPKGVSGRRRGPRGKRGGKKSLEVLFSDEPSVIVLTVNNKVLGSHFTPERLPFSFWISFKE